MYTVIFYLENSRSEIANLRLSNVPQVRTVIRANGQFEHMYDGFSFRVVRLEGQRNNIYHVFVVLQ